MLLRMRTSFTRQLRRPGDPIVTAHAYEDCVLTASIFVARFATVIFPPPTEMKSLYSKMNL